jgi:hypothetical protein
LHYVVQKVSNGPGWVVPDHSPEQGLRQCARGRSFASCSGAYLPFSRETAAWTLRYVKSRTRSAAASV